MNFIGKLISDDLTPNLVQHYGGSLRILERYLNARDNNVEEAAKLFKLGRETALKYPFEDDLSEEDEILYQKFKEQWPVKYSGFTAIGQPVLFAELSKVDAKKTMTELKEDKFSRFFVRFSAESMRLQNFASCVLRSEDDLGWSGPCDIFDAKGLSFSQLHLPSLRAFARTLKLGQCLFPDSLQKAYIINAPMLFTAVWKVVKLGINKNTLERIKISSGNCIEELTKDFGSKELALKILEGNGLSSLNLPKALPQ